MRCGRIAPDRSSVADLGGRILLIEFWWHVPPSAHRRPPSNPTSQSASPINLPLLPCRISLYNSFPLVISDLITLIFLDSPRSGGQIGCLFNVRSVRFKRGLVKTQPTVTPCSERQLHFPSSLHPSTHTYRSPCPLLILSSQTMD